jgi:hypothetical protein
MFATVGVILSVAIFAIGILAFGASVAAFPPVVLLLIIPWLAWRSAFAKVEKEVAAGVEQLLEEQREQDEVEALIDFHRGPTYHPRHDVGHDDSRAARERRALENLRRNNTTDDDLPF